MYLLLCIFFIERVLLETNATQYSATALCHSEKDCQEHQRGEDPLVKVLAKEFDISHWAHHIKEGAILNI